MPDVLDYLEWRGDLTFCEAPLNEVDNLIFCLLAYVDLDGIIPSDPRHRGVSIRAAAAEYFFSHPDCGPRPLGYIIPADILLLFRRMAYTRRYRDLLLTGFANESSEESQTQFAALTVRINDDTHFVAFRGTDDSIVGWKEDFNLSVMDEIPAQHRATVYLDSLDLPPEGHLYVGGHSKGGNLAVWGALHAKDSLRRRIRKVFSNDGPGFSEGTVTSEAYKEMEDRIFLYLPEDSFVGLLLEHTDEYTVVKSNRKGLFQHDGLSWEILGGKFIRAEGLSPMGMKNDTAVRERIEAMTHAERRELIRLMFTLLESTGAKTLTELRSGGVRTALSLLRGYRELSKEQQETAAYLWDKLVGKREEAPRGMQSERIQGKPRDFRQGVHHKATRGRIKASFFPLLLP